MTRSVDVIIPTLDRCDILRRCLEALRLQTVDHSVIVVDNASTDGTREMLREEFPEVCVVELPTNLGYGKAVNAGVAAGRGERIVLVNNDAFCDPQFVERIVEPLDPGARVGMVAALLLEADRRRIESFGLRVDRTLAAFQNLRHEPPESATRATARGLLGPMGGGAAYLRVAWEEVGGFDPRIFAYNEDVDLALRMRLRGWKPALAPGATAVHLGGATSGWMSDRQRRMHLFGRFYILRRYGLTPCSAAGARALALECATVAASVARTGNRKLIGACMAGWRAAAGDPLEIPPGAIDETIRLSDRFRHWKTYREAA